MKAFDETGLSNVGVEFQNKFIEGLFMKFDDKGNLESFFDDAIQKLKT